MSTYKQIVCATDFSAASKVAVLHAANLARELGAAFHIVHVVPDPLQQPWTAEAYALDPADLTQEWVRGAESDLVRLAATLNPPPATACRVGKPVDAILAYVHETGADLLVVGSHGHGMLAQVFLGSVAERLVRRAPCPVLTVREIPAAMPAIAEETLTHAVASQGNPLNPIV